MKDLISQVITDLCVSRTKQHSITFICIGTNFLKKLCAAPNLNQNWEHYCLMQLFPLWLKLISTVYQSLSLVLIESFKFVFCCFLFSKSCIQPDASLLMFCLPSRFILQCVVCCVKQFELWFEWNILYKIKSKSSIFFKQSSLTCALF